MFQVSNKLVLNHAILLLKRKWRKSVVQSLPSIMFSFLFSQISFITKNNSETQSYIWIYFVLSLIVTLLVSAVIYFRETTIELKSFSYLLVVGYKKRDVNLMIFLKWLLLFLMGFIIAMFAFFLFNIETQLFTDKRGLTEIIFRSFLFNFILLTGVVASFLNFKSNNEQ